MDKKFFFFYVLDSILNPCNMPVVIFSFFTLAGNKWCTYGACCYILATGWAKEKGAWCSNFSRKRIKGGYECCLDICQKGSPSFHLLSSHYYIVGSHRPKFEKKGDIFHPSSVLLTLQPPYTDSCIWFLNRLLGFYVI